MGWEVLGVPPQSWLHSNADGALRGLPEQLDLGGGKARGARRDPGAGGKERALHSSCSFLSWTASSFSLSSKQVYRVDWASANQPSLARCRLSPPL